MGIIETGDGIKITDAGRFFCFKAENFIYVPIFGTNGLKNGTKRYN